MTSAPGRPDQTSREPPSRSRHRIRAILTLPQGRPGGNEQGARTGRQLIGYPPFGYESCATRMIVLPCTR
jgi:hypothetical protein